jgi:hypothetical protein
VLEEALSPPYHQIVASFHNICDFFIRTVIVACKPIYKKNRRYTDEVWSKHNTHLVIPVTFPVRVQRARLSMMVTKIMALRVKLSSRYASQTWTPFPHSFCMSSIKVSKNISILMSACFSPEIRVVSIRYSLVAQQ